jgi:hypothetical protein
LSLAPPASGQGLAGPLPLTLVASTPSPGGSVYEGLLTTTVRNTAQCGRGPVDTTVTLGAVLSLGPPVSSAPLEPGFPEAVGEDRNPLSLVLDERMAVDVLKTGAIRLASAARFAATSPPLVLQYWDLKLGFNEEIAGRLAADHAGEAAAANLLADVHLFEPCRPALGSYPDQFAIAAGALLTATMGLQSADLTVRGATVDGTRVFAARFTGTVR